MGYLRRRASGSNKTSDTKTRGSIGTTRKRGVPCGMKLGLAIPRAPVRSARNMVSMACDEYIPKEVWE
jgi:hypothetical protein